MASGQQDSPPPRRKVSIAADPAAELRRRDHEAHRRLSVATEHGGDARLRPCLHPPSPPPLELDPGKLAVPRAHEAMSHAADSDGRKRSILCNKSPDTLSVYSHHSGLHYLENGKPANGDYGPPKKFSPSESFADRLKISAAEQSNDRPWWFAMCKKCRQPDTGIPSWEPPLWQHVCPPPFCPTYRQFARVLALSLVGLLSWGVVFAVLGHTAAPGGQLFGLAALCIAAHFGGWIFSLLNLPALVGMLVVGILFQNVGFVEIDGELKEVVSVLRRIALVIILTRAGLDLDPAALRKLWATVLKIGLVPWVVECLVVSAVSHFLLGLPWMWGLLLGSIIAAVSPAVVVPSLCRLRMKGYGVSKGIPTLIIAVSGIDDATSVAAFGIISSIMFTSESLVFQILQGPISILGGIGFGIIWGVMSKYIPEKNDPYVVPIRILMLLGGGLIAVMGSEIIGLGGAGPLGCVAAAFVSIFCWSQQGWETEDNPVATAFEIFWMIFEPILFALTGTQIIISELEPHTVSLCFACLISGIVIRMAVTVIIAIGSKLNLKEKIFVAFSCMAKASVQAALGPVALNSVVDGPADEQQHAAIVLMMCVLSILLTAPTGAIVISLSGTRLLNKTSAAPPPVEGWRRSARPSLRDITIIDEEEDSESGNNH
ncbi:sodium/hydrogen exchanger 9B2-like [Bacillus rossius redtenbacheri]|uniref:sodium/hydrogen exchanger 9B2-like n=1 Tax=Bacillus rossius redtenbacheri TaxID=93214 RepID=UPI002FDD0290